MLCSVVFTRVLNFPLFFKGIFLGLSNKFVLSATGAFYFLPDYGIGGIGIGGFPKISVS